MKIVFEEIDKTGRKIRLTKEQWTHITKKHPYMIKYEEEIRETIRKPDKITSYKFEKDIAYYYKGYKTLKSPNKFIFVLVKYLNGTGFVITSYLMEKII